MSEFSLRKRFFFVAGPYGAWPCDIALSSADDVDVHLTDDIANGGDVDFVDIERVFDPCRQTACAGTNLAKNFVGEVMEFSDIDLGHKEEPEEVRVVFE